MGNFLLNFLSIIKYNFCFQKENYIIYLKNIIKNHQLNLENFNNKNIFPVTSILFIDNTLNKPLLVRNTCDSKQNKIIFFLLLTKNIDLNTYFLSKDEYNKLMLIAESIIGEDKTNNIGLSINYYNL